MYEPGFWSKSRDDRRDLLPGCPTGLWLRLSATMLAVRVAVVFDEGALVSDTATVASSAISGFSIPERQLGATVASLQRSVAFFLGVAATAFSMDFFCRLAMWLLLLRSEFSSSSAMGLRLYGDCSAFLDELRLSAGVGPVAGPPPAFSFPAAILAGELDLGDAHLFPDAAAGDGARPFSLAGTDTIFPGCCLARSPPPEPAVATDAAAPSVRRPGDRLALRLPPPLLLRSRLPDRFRCGEPRCGDGLDTTAAATCLSQSSSAPGPPPDLAS